MKILSKNIVFSIIKVGIITALLGSLMLLGVDLFKNLETYTDYLVPFNVVSKITLLYFPEAFLTSLGPAFLFAVTYYLSMLHANNEIIGIFNAGINYKKVIIPCLFTAVCISLFYLGFNETIAINSTNKKEALFKEITNIDKNSKDSYQISLSDSKNGYLVYADAYVDSKKSLNEVDLIRHADGKISRVNANRAIWDEKVQKWNFINCYCYTMEEGKNTVKIEFKREYMPQDLEIDPELFRNLSTEVAKMDLEIANKYVKGIKNLNPTLYARAGTDLYKRLFGCLTPLVMVIIACCMNYRFKKNVLFFSIICSLCIAVVYYVIQMVTLMLANQGVIKPYMGMLYPFIIVLVLAQIESLFIKD